MIYWVRWLIRLLLIISVALFERVMGLPVGLIILTSLYAGRLDKGWRWGLLLVVGILMASLFMIPLYLAWLVIGLSYLGAKHGRQLLPSGLVRLVVGSLVGSAVVVNFGLGQLHPRQVVYGLVVTMGFIIWLKRHRFYLR